MLVGNFEVNIHEIKDDFSINFQYFRKFGSGFRCKQEVTIYQIARTVRVPKNNGKLALEKQESLSHSFLGGNSLQRSM